MFERYPELRRVLVNTKSDKAFRGVLWRRRRGYLILKQAEMIRGKGEVVKMDGELMIEASNVDFIQVVS